MRCGFRSFGSKGLGEILVLGLRVAWFIGRFVVLGLSSLAYSLFGVFGGGFGLLALLGFQSSSKAPLPQRDAKNG